ncbi:MAG: lon, ATP-dependent protease La [candidate division NC10 bacterium CSP1-5]|nr:MAG: lon, ATP-dependent protease La [candidate division NC10 bacterium CSP1-5]
MKRIKESKGVADIAAEGQGLVGSERKIPETVPVLPVRDMVVYPFMILPLYVGREKSIRAVEGALSRDRLILLVAQKDAEVEDPNSQEIYPVGTVTMIMRVLKMPDGRVKILVQGLARTRILEFLRKEPYFEARIAEILDDEVPTMGVELEALIRTVKEQVSRSASVGKQISPDILVIINNLDHPGRLADLVASHLDLKVEQAVEILEITSPEERLRRISDFLRKEIELLEVQQRIQSQAKEEIDKTQREYYLREQLRAIQKELGETDERQQEIDEFSAKIEKAKMPSPVAAEAKTQLNRLARMHPDAAEASVVRTYLEWLIELPWSKQTRDKIDIERARKILDEDHYNLEKVKERILEYLAVRKLKKNKMKGPILCFVGPPGVGKTSLGRSIARALGRKFVRISLGGVRDEAEIRGHRRTYIGALPGKIVQGIKTAGTNNPVFMMDEVDKVGADFRGDPSAALLEVLDPEQNVAFTDHYLGVAFDLSKVMFITTANMADPILPALKDRMETIEISGYTEEEKLHIARRYLIPRQLKEHGITEGQLQLTDEGVLKIIRGYTREAGLRNLEREIATVCRKVAKEVAAGRTEPFRVTAQNLHRFLKAPRYLPEPEQEQDEVGVGTGLAWTQAGGDIMYVEATVMKGKGQLLLTGHLGEVMKESAQAALSYARARAPELRVKEDLFSKVDIHIHVPAGAIPKDGPSAGITMATALISALTRVAVKRSVAMTGEVTLRGKVLPVGGVKEKVLAARRGGITTVLLPQKNDKDVKELPKTIRRGMHFVFVEHMDQVLAAALVRPVKEKGQVGIAAAKRPTPAMTVH